ncbi:hypothetical protein [Bradyrhizobium sp.]|uniref:hypothetical protein n=1 Tax=Bradyrhizobium sp. TaxID=376 RepID=UPI002D6F3949|nr:hypothetical protein [Bradyrhizobium sp.]HZR74539.1 hypothetical protein [Bradyrhizobium sp.]
MIQRKPLELSPEIARGFVRAMNDYFAEPDKYKRDAILAHQLSVLKQFDNKLRLDDVRVLFEQMKKSTRQ